jgi:hypothetical protein
VGSLRFTRGRLTCFFRVLVRTCKFSS